MTVPREYVEARRVLLDALQALGDHLSSFVLVGAQAVYLHAGAETGVGGIPMTTDGDLMINADLLAPDPEITGVLQGAGFSGSHNPGSWVSPEGVAIDIMVCPHQSGRTGSNKRSGRLPPHANHLARITKGLEPALVDHTGMTLRALDPTDSRTTDVKVAGPAALVVAKLTKIAERTAEADSGRRDRSRDKDAVDILRILVGVEMRTLIEGFALHRPIPEARLVSDAAVQFLATNQGQGGQGALRRLIMQGLPGEPVALAQWDYLVGELLASIRSEKT